MRLLNKKGASRFSFLTNLCGISVKCIAPSTCACENNQCKGSYNNDKEKIKSAFNTVLSADENCDIDLATSLITEKSKEIVHPTCSNMAAERECIINRGYKVLVKNDTAIIYFDDFSHKTGWPYFFAKENGEWKLDFYKMAFGIAMGGSGCDTGWGWRNEEIKKEFCSYFKEGECPEEINFQNSDTSCNVNDDCIPRFSHCDCKFQCINKLVKIKDCSNICNVLPEAPVCYCVNNECTNIFIDRQTTIAYAQDYLRKNNIDVLDINNPHEVIERDDYWYVSFEIKPESVPLPPYRSFNVDKKTGETYEIPRL